MERRGVPLVLLLLVAAWAGQHDIYTGYNVHKITLADQTEQDLIQHLEQTLDLDTWQHGMAGRRDAIVMVSPTHRQRLVEELDTAGVKHTVVTDNVADLLKEQDEERSRWKQSRASAGERTMTFEDYPRYHEVTDYLRYLAATYPNEATLVNAGPSFEGRDVLYLKVSSSNFQDDSKPIYFINAMIHGREWSTTPVALYVLHRLLEVRAEGEEDLLAGTDWIVLPVVNPDGYEYSHTNQRMWLRTRSVNTSVSSSCAGADAHRNFDYNFNTYGVSSNPCSDAYPGLAAFSEVETQYVRNIILENVDRLQVYMDIHSFGNYILYGYDDAEPPNPDQLFTLGSFMGAAMDVHKLPSAFYYYVGNSALVLMTRKSGTSQDWAQSVGVTFSYTLELPGHMYGFAPPPSLIPHVTMETWDGIKISARIAKIFFDAARA